MKTIIVMLLAVLASGPTGVCMPKARYTLAEAQALFQKADAGLNKAYNGALAELDKTKAAQLRNYEREWISYRDEMVAHDFHEEHPERNPDYWECLAIYAHERAEFVHAWSGKHIPPGITGEYSDSYGGALELTETTDGVEFSLSVTRGRAHNEGEMDGILQIKDGNAYFKEKLEPGEEGPPCELAFTFIEGHIVKIEEKVASHDVGFNVHFGGDYYKTGSLKKPDGEPPATVTPATTATAPAEKPTVEQARKTFEATDNLLTIAYKEAGAGLDPAKMSGLRQNERDWIQYREMLAKSAPFFNNGSQTDSPKATIDYWQVMNEITLGRIEFLRAWSGKKAPAGITGVYSDSRGGTLELEERKSGLAFSISTVRGMARNKGKIEGVAQRTGDKLFYKDHPDAEDDRPPCEITLTFIEGHIVKVEEKNGDFYHGFNAGFDGLYYKTGKVEKALKAE